MCYHCMSVQVQLSVRMSVRMSVRWSYVSFVSELLGRPTPSPTPTHCCNVAAAIAAILRSDRCTVRHTML